LLCADQRPEGFDRGEHEQKQHLGRANGVGGGE